MEKGEEKVRKAETQDEIGKWKKEHKWKKE